MYRKAERKPIAVPRHDEVPDGFVVTSDYSGVAAVLAQDDLDAVVDIFKDLRQP